MKDSNIRLSRPTDIGNLVALDLKTYQYPLSMADWQKLVKTSGQDKEPRVVVIEVSKKAVGFATWEMKEKVCQIVRIGVLQRYRLKGYGRKLVEQCVMEAVRSRKKKLRISIPEIRCVPDDDDNIVGFLNATGFKPTGEVVENFGVYYGDMVDAYIFEREV